jgi:hypothetical protein
MRWAGKWSTPVRPRKSASRLSGESRSRIRPALPARHAGSIGGYCTSVALAMLLGCQSASSPSNAHNPFVGRTRIPPPPTGAAALTPPPGTPAMSAPGTPALPTPNAALGPGTGIAAGAAAPTAAAYGLSPAAGTFGNSAALSGAISAPPSPANIAPLNPSPYSAPAGSLPPGNSVPVRSSAPMHGNPWSSTLLSSPTAGIRPSASAGTASAGQSTLFPRWLSGGGSGVSPGYPVAAPPAFPMGVRQPGTTQTMPSIATQGTPVAPGPISPNSPIFFGATPAGTANPPVSTFAPGNGPSAPATLATPATTPPNTSTPTPTPTPNQPPSTPSSSTPGTTLPPKTAGTDTPLGVISGGVSGVSPGRRQIIRELETRPHRAADLPQYAPIPINAVGSGTPGGGLSGPTDSRGSGLAAGTTRNLADLPPR